MQSEIQRKVKSIDPSKIDEVKNLYEKYKKEFDNSVVKYQKQLDSMKLRRQLKSFHKDVSSIQKEIQIMGKKKDLLLNSKEVMQTKINLSSIKKMEKTINAEESQFLDDLRDLLSENGLSFKDYEKEYEGACFSKEYLIKPHQKFLYNFSRPNVEGNLLVYQDMGTGKTCGIIQCILSIAKYYANAPQTTPIGILLLLQNLDNKTLYIREFDKGCQYMEEGVQIKKVAENIREILIPGIPLFYLISSDNNLRFYRKNESNNKNETFVYVTISKMTNKVNGNPKIFKKENYYMPSKGGAVIVDEAHNLINPAYLKTIGNSPILQEYKKGIFESKVKKIFFTGTPSNDFTKTEYIFQLLNMLVYRKFSNKIDNWFKESDYFNPDGTFIPEKKNELIDRIKHVISYFSYQYDYSVFPKLEANVKYAPNTRFTDDKGGLLLNYDDSTKEFMKSGETEGRPAIYVKVKPTSSNSDRGRRGLAKTKTHTFKTADNKHEAIAYMVYYNINAKHFFFMDVPTASRPGMEIFAKKKLMDNLNTISGNNKNEKFQLLQLGLKWFIKDVDIPEFQTKLFDHIDRLKQKSNSNIFIFVILEGKTVIQRKNNSEDLHFSFKKTTNRMVDPISLFKFLYNHEKNKDGRYIKFVFGTQDFKEGLDLFSTTYVHFLAPPESISVYEQALARAARFCSFRHVSDKTKHFYTPILYFEDDEKESRRVFRIISQKKTPTELVLDLMKEVSVDCSLHTSKTKIKCNSKTSIDFSMNNQNNYCVSPFNLLTSSKRKNISCYTLLNIPSNKSFSEFDYVLKKLLEKNNISPKRLQLGNFLETIKSAFNYYYRTKNISLQTVHSSLEYLYYTLINTSSEEKKYTQAILAILQNRFNSLSPKVKNAFDNHQDLEKIIETLYNKGNKLQTIVNYKDLLSEIKASMNEWKNIKKQYSEIITKTKNPSIKLVSGTTRSGKIYNERQLRARKSPRSLDNR